MAVKDEIVCPKHRVVFRDGVCRVCQAEHYDKYYRKYGKSAEETQKLQEDVKKEVKDSKKFKKPSLKKPINKVKDRKITESDLEKLRAKFNVKQS